MQQSGDALGAAMQLDAAAFSSGDPVLFLDAAEAYFQAGQKDRDASSIRMGIERANVALDVLNFLGGPGSSSEWQPVARSELSSLVTRANDHLRKSNELLQEIEATPADEALAEPEKVDKPKGSGRGLVIAGAVLTAAGVAGAGVGVTGLVLGQMRQNDAVDPTVYGDEYDEVDRQGKLANVLAYVGFIAGGAMLATGVALLVVGKKRQSSSAAASLRVYPTIAGLGVSGRF